MSTSGKSAWEKYFSNGDVDTVIKKRAIIYENSGKRTSNYIEVNEPITVPNQLKYINPISVLYNSKQTNISFNCIKKPIVKKGATELLGISATKLTQGAEIQAINIKNKTFDAVTFKNNDELIPIINDNLNEISTVSDHVNDAVSDYLCQTDYSEIKWPSEIEPHEKNELGKYFGELLPGIMGFNDELEIIKKDDIDLFILPCSPSFHGIDSFFRTNDSFIPMSSKFGCNNNNGAKASFFSNILPELIELYKKDFNYIKSNLLICIIKSSKNLNPLLNGKKIIYRYGFEHILKITIDDSYGVYLKIKNGIIDNEILSIKNEILKNEWPELEKAEGKVKNNLMNSLTSFFSRIIAYRLNHNHKAINNIIDIISNKNFYQVVLNKIKWNDGIVDFKIQKSCNTKINFIGSKAPIGDIQSKQGMINYELK